jgi:stearoyl-CoA desaturase (delta-9 desaturase)
MAGVPLGDVVSTVVPYDCTFSINSLAHLWDTRRFDTADESRNNWCLAHITLGEDWRNNHHYSPGSRRQGERWWEIDITYLILKTLSWSGLARDLRPFGKFASSASIAQVAS